MIVVDVILLVVFLILIGTFSFNYFKGDLGSDAGCSFWTIIIILGLCLGCCSLPRYVEWTGDRESRDAHNQMMETSFQSSPGLKTTFNKLQAEIDKWKESEEKFTRLEKAAQTAGGRSLAKEKLAGIGQVLSKLRESREKTLEQIEMIAMESEGQFTELDRKALDDLSLKVEDSLRDASELREGLLPQIPRAEVIEEFPVDQ